MSRRSNQDFSPFRSMHAEGGSVAKKTVPAIQVDDGSVLLTPKDYFRSVTSPGRDDGLLTVR